MKPWQSVVTRLILCLMAGGLMMSAAISALEWRRGRAELANDLTQQTTVTVRNLQSVLRGVLNETDTASAHTVLSVFVSGDHHLRAARLQASGTDSVLVGRWDDGVGAAKDVWMLNELGVSDGEIGLEQLTVVKAPFTHGGKSMALDLLVDGPEAVRQMRQNLYGNMATVWLFLAVVILLGLLMMRRWFTGPLQEVTELVTMNAGPESFHRLARHQLGEFAQLTCAMARMLEASEQTAEKLAQRERAFASLYQHAPTAMISLDPSGKVVEANRRAADLLGAEDAASLVGREGVSFAVIEDQPLLRQTIDRLAYQDAARCDLRINAMGNRLDCAIEAVGNRDADGVLRSARLSLIDVSDAKRLQRDLEDQSRLLNLVIDHMSDAIVLVDASRRVAAFNQQMANLLHVRPDTLTRMRFDHADFWDTLGVLNKETFVGRLRQIEADMDRPAQERFETRSGVFLFQGIPVHDATGKPVGRMWVLRETSPQEHSQRLLKQQNHQLQVLKETGAALRDAYRVDDLMCRGIEQLYQGMGVDAVGIAVRSADKDKRCRQLIHRGSGAYLLDTNRRLTEAIARYLMPQILNAKDVAFWTDLQIKSPWAEAARGAGLTCMAAAPLRGPNDAQGIVWVARRGGERLDRHQIVMLETIAPLLAARLQLAQLAENMQQAGLSDPATGLPNAEQLDLMLHQQMRRPGQACAVIAIHLDHFDRINAMLGHERADHMLKCIGDRLLSRCRRSTFVARLHGPDFAVVAPDSTAESVVGLAERLLQAIREEQVVGPDGKPSPITASIGVASSPRDGRTPFDARDAALTRAEIARQAGRDRVVHEGPAPHRAAG